MFLPKAIKRNLETSRFYMTLRYSKPVYWFWLLLRRDVRKEIIVKRNLYQSLLPDGCRLIFDIGANEGVLTNIFRNISDEVIAVEPSRRNRKILFARFSRKKKITIVSEAVSQNTGQQEWYENEDDYAMGTLSEKWNRQKKTPENAGATLTATTTLDHLITQYGKPGYIKIDIEGHEWQALQGLTQPVPLVSFEAILPQFFQETVACIKYLSALHSHASFNYVIDNKFVYNDFQDLKKISGDIKGLNQTVDIFCKTDSLLF